MIGITGLGGVGKTTLASVVFNRIANRFDGKSFVQNVRERSKDPRGLQDMQKQILTSVFGDQSIDVPSVVEGRNMMEKRMPSIKVLVVLDDVKDGKQLEELAESSWFRPGSRIIITSRERQVLVAHGVQSHNIHDVSTLSNEDAIRLHSRYAFKTESPAQGYEELSKEVLRYVAGLPLTIKTLSSFLCARPTDVWKNAIKRLETIPWGDTLKILEISYDALEKDQKDIFLYVACLLKGKTKKKAIRILESLGFYAPVGLSDLKQKSLITFRDGGDDDDDKKLVLHDHIEEMGMHIVHRLDPDEPERHKLLWIKDEIENIVQKDMGTEAIRGIKLLQTGVHPAKISQSLIKMSKLCFLHVGWGLSYYTQYEFDEAGKYLPNSLQFLRWHGYPYRYLPKTFDADKLVQMEMPESYIHQLWEGREKKVLPKLKLLNLRYSKLETFDSEITPNLEELVLKGCQNLVEVNISGKCSHVKKLDLSKSKLRSLNIGLTPNLEVLQLDRCEDLEELVMLECQKLTTLSLISAPKLRKKLTKLSLISAPKLRSLNLGLTSNLEQLLFSNCKDLEELVMPVECQKLTTLSLISAPKLRSLNLGLTPNLEQLHLDTCKDLEELIMPVECQKLTTLSLISAPKLRSLNLGLTSNLEQLLFSDCKNLEELVMLECQKVTKISLISATKLRSLNLGLTPNLEVLKLDKCKNLEELVMPVECQKLTTLSLICAPKLRSLNLRMTPNLEKLLLLDCEDFEEIYVPVERPARLRVLSLSSFQSNGKPGPLSYLEKLKSLEELCLSFEDMNRLPDSIYMLKHLRVLNLGLCRNLKQLPEDLDRLECLEELHVNGCHSLRNTASVR